MNKLRVAFFISGSGSTMEACMKATKCGRLSYTETVLVVSSNDKAGGKTKARYLGLNNDSNITLNPKQFAYNAEHFGEALIKECDSRGVDLIAQCGWMVHTPNNLVEVYRTRSLNQHPTPLDPGYPDFGGKGMMGRAAHLAVLWFARRINRPFCTEATVQRVDEQYDLGDILGIRSVPIWYGDDVESLKDRVLPYEHDLVISVIEQFSYSRVCEVNRYNRLVQDEEKKLWSMAVKIGTETYPKG